MPPAVQSLTHPKTGKDMVNRRRLILGTANFGMNYGVTNSRGEVPMEEIQAILGLCRENGIKELDTAQAYGRAEEKLGEAGVDDFAITTKLQIHPEENTASIKDKFEQSLQRLRVKKIENLLLHNSACLYREDADMLVREMQRLVKEDLVARVGLSSYEPAEAMALSGKSGFEIVQLPANVLDNRLFEHGIMDSFSRAGVQVQVRSVFLQGVLLADTKERKNLPEAVRQRAEVFRAKCLEQGISPLEACLEHVLAATPITRVVVGVSQVQEMREIIAATAQPKALGGFSAQTWNRYLDPRTWVE